MDRIRNLIGKRKIMFAALTVLCCIALSATVLFSVRAASVDAPPPAQTTQAAPQPLRAYSELTVDVPEALTIYADRTTVADFKNNITVTGGYTLTDGGAPTFVTLNPSEYVVKIGEKTLADGDKFYNAGDDVTPTIVLTVDCGTASVQTDEIAVAETLPTYTAVSVALPSGVTAIENIHTAETLKNLLVVSGTRTDADGEEIVEVIANKELYTLTLSPENLVGQSKATVTVTYNGVSSAPTVFTVSRATVQSIDVAVLPTLEYRDGYYKYYDATDKVYYTAFVAGMKSAEILKSLQVSVVYRSGTRVVTADNAAALDIDTYYVEDRPYNDGLQTIKTSVGFKDGSLKDATITVPFEVRKEVKLTAEYKGGVTSFTSGTQLNKSDFAVTAKYNDKIEQPKYSDFTIDGSLAPNADNIDEIAAGATSYSRTVRLSVTKDAAVYFDVLFTNIRHIPPTGIRTITGTLKTQQTVLEKFDLSGLVAEMRYGTTTVSIPLSEHPDWCEISYENDVTGWTGKTNDGIHTIPQDALGEDIYIQIKFTYNKNNQSALGDKSFMAQIANRINVQRAEYALPTLDVTAISYSNGCNKRIAFDGDMKAPMTVAVSGEAGHSSVITYAPGAETSVTNDNNAGATVAADGTITFARGGTFTVTVTLTENEAGAYQWAATTARNPQRTDYTLTYTIVVNKARLDIRLTDKTTGNAIDPQKGLNVVYGGLKSALDNIGISGSIVGTSTAIQDPPAFDLYIYGSNIAGSNYETPTLVDMAALTAKQVYSVVGTYKLIAVTSADSLAYTQSTTYENFAVTLTIEPKPIEPTQIATSKPYNRTDYVGENKLSEIVNISNDLFAYGDTFETAVGITTTATAMQHVGDYPLSLTFKPIGGKYNYMWQGKTATAYTTDGSFEITAISYDLHASVANAQFTFGTNTDPNPTTQETTGDRYYPVISAPTYYAATLVDGQYVKTGDLITLDETTPAGHYVAYYSTSVNTSAGDADGDYNLPTATAHFEILRKTVTPVSLDTSAHEYDATAHTFTLSDFDGDFMSYTVTAVTFDINGVATETELKFAAAGSGSETVTRAGQYTVTVSFTDDNHAWDSGLTDFADKTLTYTVTQKVIGIDWGELEQEYTDGMAKWKPSPTATALAAGEPNTVTFTTTAFDKNNSESTDGFAVAGEYRIEIIGISSTDYKLPAVYFTTFTIGRATLDLPAAEVGKGDAQSNLTLDKVTVTTAGGVTFTAVYRGSAFDVFRYLLGYVGKVTVEYKVNGQSVSAEDLKDAATYTLIITPEANYVWSDSADLETQPTKQVKFVIDPLPVTVNWTASDTVYSGTAQRFAAAVNNKIAGDEVYAVIGGDGITTGERGTATVTNAGSYTATVSGLSGARAANYRLSTSETSTYTKSFVVKKQTVKTPTASGAYTFDPTAADKTIAFSTDDLNRAWTWFSANATASVTQQYKFAGESWASAQTAVADAFDLASGKLTYAHAGLYEVTFALKDSANYCWADDGKQTDFGFAGQYSKAVAVTVDRKSLSVPKLTGGNEATDSRTFIRVAGTEMKPGALVDWTGPTVTTEWVTVRCDGTDDFIDKGLYAVRYTVAAGENPHDYVWTASNFTVENETIQNLLGGGDGVTIVYDETEVSLTVRYAITGTILYLGYDIDDYTFGANVDSTDFLQTMLQVTNTQGETDVDTLKTEYENKLVTLELTFTDAAGKTAVVVCAYGETTSVTDGTGMLENGMPWNAGTYTVTGKWIFDALSAYQTPDIDIRFTVKQRAATVVWSAGDGAITQDAIDKNKFSVLYDGNTHTLTGVVNNAPTRTSTGTKKTPTFTVIGGDEKNAGTYTLKGTLSGDDAANFCWSETESNAATLSINKRKVTMQAAAVTHIYGDAVPTENAWTVTANAGDDGFVGGEETAARGYVTVVFTGGTVTPLTAVGANRQIGLAVADDAEATAFWGNYDYTFGEADYTITPRPITVTVTGDMTSVYGEAVKLGGVTVENYAQYYTLAYTGDTDKVALPTGETGALFTAFAKESAAADAMDVSATTDIGTYAIDLRDENANYSITLAGNPQYTITAATLTVAVNLEIAYGERSPLDYDGHGNKYKMTNADLREKNGIYHIDPADFKNGDAERYFYKDGDDTFAFNDAAFTYAVDYTQWQVLTGGTDDVMGQVVITFNPNGLTWGNYVFAAADGAAQGVLTVKKQPIAVTLDDKTAVYYTAQQALTFTVAAVPSSYGLAENVPHHKDGETLADIFTVAVKDLTTKDMDGETVVTNGVTSAGLAIVGSVTDGATAKYVVTFNTAKYVITAAEITDVTIPAAQNLKYNEQKQSILTTAVTAETVDGCASTVLYYLSHNDTLPQGFVWDTATDGVSTEIPQVFHAGTYWLHYRILAGNHADKDGRNGIVVAKGDNALTAFDYTKDGDSAIADYAGGDLAAALGGLTGNAWIYGDYQIENMAGTFTAPIAKFDGAEAGATGGSKMTVTLTFYKTAGGTAKTLLDSVSLSNAGSAIEIKTLLDGAFGETFRYDAGYYVLTYTMPAGTGTADGAAYTDYDAITKTRIFKVGKATLAVTPDNDETTYGELYTPQKGHGVSYSGWVYDEGETLVDKSQFAWTTGYIQGNPVAAAGYEIMIAAGNTYTEIDNYTFDLTAKGTLLVKKRILEVEIGDKVNTFDLLGDDLNAKPTDLGNPKLINGTSYYKNDRPIALKTHALDSVGDAATNNAGVYPIYLVWKDAESRNNYEVRFVNCGYTGAFTDDEQAEAVQQDGAIYAGTYTIESATLTPSIEGAGTVTYNGKAHTVKVTGTREGVTANIEFTVYYTKAGTTEATTTAPINVGTYTITAKYEAAGNQQTPNYIVSDLSTQLIISRAKLAVEIVGGAFGAKIEYGTPLPASVDWTAGATEKLGASDRFSGYSLRFYIGAAVSLDDILAQEKGNGAAMQVAFTFESADYTPTVAAGSTCSVTVGGIESENYTLEQKNAANNLRVERRKITVTVKDNTVQKMTYTGAKQQSILEGLYQADHAAFFGLPTDWAGSSGIDVGALNLTLSIGDAKDVKRVGNTFDGYTMTPNYTNGNFAVTFTDTNGHNFGQEDYAAQYVITPARLTVSVYYGEQASAVNSHTVTYGNDVQFAYSFDGFKGTESYTNLEGGKNDADALYRTGSLGDPYYLVGQTQTNYTPWETGVGKYSMLFDIDGLSFLNYDLTVGNATILTVTKRTITASIDKNTFPIYNRGEIDSNGGAHGETIDAIVAFAGVDAAHSGYLPTLNNGYTLTYAGAGTTPNVAGDYKVTVTLAANSNYALSDATALDYTIKPMEIEIGWDNPSITDFEKPETDKVRKVAAFNGAIMAIPTNGFVNRVNVGDTLKETPVVEGDGTDGTYKIDAAGLTFTANATGTYYLQIDLTVPNGLKNSNYRLKRGTALAESVTLILEVTANRVTVTVEMTGSEWTYLQLTDPAGVATVKVDNVDRTDAAMTYALVTNAGAAVEALIGTAFNDTETDPDTGYTVKLATLGVTFGSFGAQVYTGDVGIYVLRAQYAGQSGFYVFRITPKAIDAPTFTAGATNDRYTGSPLTLSIALTAEQKAAVNVFADTVSSIATTTDGVALTATNAGTYVVTFGLRSRNYIWADGNTDDKTQDWIVGKATDVVTFDGDMTVVYGVTYAPLAASKFGAPIEYYYSDSLTQPGSEEAAKWRKLPYTDHGVYWIMAKSVGNANYDGHFAIIGLTIEKATLYATPSGSLVYGERFDPAHDYGYALRGFVAGDTELGTAPIGGVNVRYVLYRDGVEVTDHSTLLDAGGNYALELKTAGGEVEGLTYRNYRVLTGKGAFAVLKKDVRIIVGNRTSVYGDALDLGVDSRVTVTGGVDAAMLQLTLSLVGVNGTPDAGSYNIEVLCGNRNYNATVSSGIYTVTAKEIHIGDGGIAVGGGTVGHVTATRVTDLFDARGERVADAALYEALRYAYNTADGNMPTHVGTYTVTVTIDNRNYQLTGQIAYTFYVNKNVYRVSDISIAPMPYTGNAVAPQIVFGDYDADAFEVTYAANAVNVGKYDVTIRIKQFGDNRWELTESDTQTLTFEIVPAKSWVTKLEIASWVYGQYSSERNAPKVAGVFDPNGDIDTYVFVYRGTDGKVIDGIPTEAGQYTVSVRMTPASGNYYYAADSDENIGSVMFTITPATCAVPTLTVVSEGEGKNDTYTGSTLQALIDGFDTTRMDVVYGGVSNLSGGSLYVQAVGAGTYSVTLVLKNQNNYVWAKDGVFDSDGNAVLTWTVNKQKVARPTDSGKKLIVNGKILEYFPDGFDPAIMTITDNRSGYGGTFTATVGLADPDNYEWEDGTTDAVSYVWRVVGSNTVFAAVIGSLSGAVGVAAALAAVQYVLYRKKKRAEAEAEAVA